MGASPFDPALFLRALDHAGKGLAQRLAGKVEVRTRDLRRRWRFTQPCGEPAHYSAAIAGARAPSADIAAAWPCAMESSMVSGPVAAPATNTPGRLVAPITP